MANCKQCNEKIISQSKHRRIFCSAECRSTWYIDNRQRAIRTGTKHATATRSVLIIAADLAARGWEVYFPFDRAVSDLVGIKEERIIKFEIRTAQKSLDGKWSWPRLARDNGKVYAVVALDQGNEILYEPTID